MPVRPWLTKLCSVGLVANLMVIPNELILEILEDSVQGDLRELANLAQVINFLWGALAWPIVSAFALLYTWFVDRDTKWFKPKLVIAFLMLALWLVGCGLFAAMIDNPTDDDF
jgi:uncharacterized BrkB/YihY/UPF0761 family membrane protein